MVILRLGHLTNGNERQFARLCISRVKIIPITRKKHLPEVSIEVLDDSCLAECFVNHLRPNFSFASDSNYKDFLIGVENHLRQSTSDGDRLCLATMKLWTVQKHLKLRAQAFYLTREIHHRPVCGLLFWHIEHMIIHLK